MGMTVRQAKSLIGKTIEVRSMHFEVFSMVLIEQEKPRSQCFWYANPSNLSSRGLINVTTLTITKQ
jgi:hypothetical protein